MLRNLRRSFILIVACAAAAPGHSQELRIDTAALQRDAFCLGYLQGTTNWYRDYLKLSPSDENARRNLDQEIAYQTIYRSKVKGILDATMWRPDIVIIVGNQGQAAEAAWKKCHETGECSAGLPCVVAPPP
jgi:hypothetical protein